MIDAVPYISQWDATAHLARGDCGIVSACMIARWKGIETTPDDMLLRAGLSIGRKTYTFPEVIRAADVAGVTLEYRAGATRSVIRAELAVGRPVISLLRYGKISGNQDDFDGAHFWLCIGFDVDAVYVHDPNWWEPRRAEGAARRIPNAEFDRAIGEPLRETGNQPFQALLYRD